MSLHEIVRQATSRAGTIRVSNALNPLLWMCALSPATWLFAYLLRSDVLLEYFLVGLGSFPVICVIVAYFIFLFRDPDRLQSEAFVLRQQELAIIERKAGHVTSPETDPPVERIPLSHLTREESER